MDATSTPRALAAPRVLAAVATAFGILACAAPAAAITGATKLEYTGGEQTYPVPSGVTLLEIEAVGAAGGGFDTTGFGMNLDGYLPVAPGQTLYGEVGQAGAYAYSGSGGPTFGGGGAAGGFPREN